MRTQQKIVGARWRSVLLACVSVLVLGACASVETSNAKDPYEGFNRAMFDVNEALDTTLLKPAAKGYDAVVPLPAKMGVNNFFENIWDVNHGANALLQGKAQEGFTGFGRLLINSTIGIFGLFDVASEMGLDKGDEDFGQTFAVWGMGDGPYLFVPFIGPSNVRDLAGWGVDQYFYPLWWHIDDIPLRNSMVALRVVELRSSLLPADRVVEEAALDKYAYLRSAYFQRRRAQIFDGAAPAATEE